MDRGTLTTAARKRRAGVARDATCSVAIAKADVVAENISIVAPRQESNNLFTFLFKL